MQQQDNNEYAFLYQRQTCHQVQPNQATYPKRQKCQPATYLQEVLYHCYNVLPQLDINNTIDHRPEGDEKWFLENEKTVTQFCRKLAAERPLKDIRDEYNYPKKKGIKDECS